MHSTEGLETPRTGRNKRRPKIDRAVAEDYRHARSVQKLMQGVCTTQMVLSIVLALMSGNFALLSFLFGDAFGLAATFARVQRMHGVCAVFNVSYLLSSCGMPVVLAIALASDGFSATHRIRVGIPRSASPRRAFASSRVVVGRDATVTTTRASPRAWRRASVDARRRARSRSVASNPRRPHTRV